MKEKIETILARVVPNAFTIVRENLNRFSGKMEIAIMIAATNDEINRVKGQYPACVSLLLEVESNTLQTQVFGGMGGQHVYRNPRKQLDSERYLALKSIKIPFRKPSSNETAVLKAIEKFAVNWRETVKENLAEMPYSYDYETATKI